MGVWARLRVDKVPERGKRCNCLLWLLKIVFDAAGPFERSLRLISFILLYFMCASQYFTRALEQVPGPLCLCVLAPSRFSATILRQTHQASLHLSCKLWMTVCLSLLVLTTCPGCNRPSPSTQTHRRTSTTPSVTLSVIWCFPLNETKRAKTLMN